MEKTTNLIQEIDKLIRFSKIGISYNNDEIRLKKWGLTIGDFIQVEKTKDIDGIIYNKLEEGRIYVVLGILNSNLYVRGINNRHWGYLPFEHVIKYKKLKYTELIKG